MTWMDRDPDEASPWTVAERQAKVKDDAMLREMANESARAMRATWDKIQADWRART